MTLQQLKEQGEKEFGQVFPHKLMEVIDDFGSSVNSELLYWHNSQIDLAYQAGKEEICICSAIRLPDGLIIRGHRHPDCFNNLAGRPKYKGKHFEAEEGFITSKNRFVDREEGRKLQDEAGILSVDSEGYRGNILFSEDLY